MTWLGYNTEFDNPNKEQYNSVPVLYCKDCLNLAIIEEIEDIPSCNKCNSVNIGECSIQEWDEMFFKKYGYHYLNKKSPLVDGIRTHIKKY